MMEKAPDDVLLTYKDIREMGGPCKDTIKRKAKLGLIKITKVSQRGDRIRLSEWQRYLDACSA
jgi:hypothetical protein